MNGDPALIPPALLADMQTHMMAFATCRTYQNARRLAATVRRVVDCSDPSAVGKDGRATDADVAEYLMENADKFDALTLPGVH